MDSILQFEENALSAFQDNFNTGNYGGVKFILEGTNATGQTGTLSDIGSITIKRNGTTVEERSLEFYANRGNIKAGANLFSSTTAGAFKAGVTIPFFLRGLGQNAYSIQKENEFNFEYRPSASASTVFDSMTIKVYGLLSAAPESYVIKRLSQDITESAAITNRPYPLGRENIANVYLNKPAELTNIGLEINKRQFVSLQDVDSLEQDTLFANQLESTTAPLINIKTFDDGIPLTAQNRGNTLFVSLSGAATLEVTTEQVIFKR